MTPREQAEAMVGVIRPWIKAATEPLVAQISALEKRLNDLPVPANGKDGTNGENGKDAVVDYKWVSEQLDTLVAETVATAVKEIPVPQNGKDGEPGKDADPLDLGAVSLIVEALVEESVSKIPPAPAGKDGETGTQGIQGEKGDSVVGPVGESAYECAVRKGFRGDESAWLESLVGPIGRDGRDAQGAKGEDGTPGKDGADLDDFELLEEDHGVKVLRLTRGDRIKEFRFRVAEREHKGVFKADQTYWKGNEVQAGGSMFTARVDNPKGTPGNSEDWILTAKRGQNGRDLRNGERDTSKPYKLGDRT